MSLNHLKLYLSKEIIEKKDEKRKVELIGALLKAGCERSNIFVDKISEEKSERLGLTHCMESLQQDLVLIARVSRLTTIDFSSIYNYIDKKILTKKSKRN